MTRQQKWAKEAYARVSARVGTSDVRDYRTLCMKMPVLIMQSGLVQAVAFMRSRGELGKDFSGDLARVYGITAADPGKDLMEKAQGADELTLYLALTRDILDASTWLRRFAQSELPSGGEG
jgi:CRISPR/Cas system CMR-associated protein Cmr5 small subunit